MINNQLPWVDATVQTPECQDDQCLIVLKYEEGVVVADELYFFNGFKWWPCSGHYYDFKPGTEEILVNYGVWPQDVALWLPVYTVYQAPEAAAMELIDTVLGKE